ncbi:MAG TPA: AraC family transcriptional regulator [Polyangiaceae bacterium]|nr:AraC family transcriptional regulator [Polyangiaceae bacterium]
MNARGARSGFRASTPIVWPLLGELRALGHDVERLVAGVGLSLPELEDPDTRLPIESLIELGAAAATATNDPAFGLHLAEHYRPNAFGVLDYLAHSSRTLGEAIRHLCRYNRLFQDAAETVLDVEGDRALVWQRTLGGFVMPPPMVENSMANLIVIGRELTGRDLVPVEVTFVHAEPPYSAEHARLFRATVRFEAERDGIVLPAAALDYPLPGADPRLCDILERHARQILAKTPRVDLFSHRVRELCAAELRDGAPTAAKLAADLKISERTLRRRLGEEGTSWEDVLDGLRRDLAERYLGEPRLGIDDVALMLGYSEAGAFRRAFKRWFGQSPAEWRKGSNR